MLLRVVHILGEIDFRQLVYPTTTIPLAACMSVCQSVCLSICPSPSLSLFLSAFHLLYKDTSEFVVFSGSFGDAFARLSSCIAIKFL